MAKFNPKQAQVYVQTLQEVLTITQDTADRVAPFFTKLDDAKETNAVADIPAAEFAEIKAEFEDAVAAYQKNAQILNTVQAPVRLLGLHKSLAKNYSAYAEATNMMSDALNVTDQTVDDALYVKSEEDQELYLGKIQANVSKIMMGAGR
ncbi:chemotaxis protein [Leuconostoc suionicum]|uniref:Chemotaxis protein n=1 Tax=Leuconostoc suionicum TaxID=1511761 RepID=A0A2N9K9X7_9LACO|nr:MULTISPECIES: chemotaxis protein [Leuconostoc]API71520.1 chemotaxis protein [Leuconostoc suionicum]MCT4401492.1 chemotaxis protein [Leuconostoc suionicum]MDI6497839.1 chemotaxis protein [Leuconostoc suionicum]MDI6499911.1 chemotaxis protein [Leuconostoc suionicum]MDI6501940.1 chemotaxis protein [Leuconostoc suionicum]